MRRTLTLVLAAAALAACANRTPEPRENTMDRLRSECEARNGMLIPSGGPITGNDETDYLCDIKDSGGRLK